ncbi:MAG TPA: sugar phosphate isomerase/epimerase family protein [Bryobacteraceae bacterium]|nr:sugar phosphate isomerase/epimerase family protein [Bryobacteraceae bacterium]
MSFRLPQLTRRDWMFLTAAAAFAKTASTRIACQCYVFEQDYGSRKQKTIDHVDEILATVAGAGFHAVELTSNYFPPDKTADSLALIDKHGLALPIAYIGGPMHDDRWHHTYDLALAMADRLKPHPGLEAISFNCDPKPKAEAKTDAELEVEAQALETLGTDLKKRGLRLLVHAHAPEMANHAREWRYFVHHTTPADVGICLDTHWVFRGGENVLDILNEAGTRIGDVHVRNSTNGIWMEDVGDGDVDYKAVATALKKLKYKGWLTVELAWDPTTPHTRPLGENLKRSREYVERIFATT